MTLQMSKSLIEGGGVGIHIYTHYNIAYRYTLHNSSPQIILYNAPMYCTVACLLPFTYDSLVTLFF